MRKSFRMSTYDTPCMLFLAHTKDSAKALVETIDMAFPGARLALVVAMASDKDHVGFAREFLSGVFVEFTLYRYEKEGKS